jgi:hypothetical protein
VISPDSPDYNATACAKLTLSQPLTRALVESACAGPRQIIFQGRGDEDEVAMAIGSFETMSIFWKFKVLVGDQSMPMVLLDATR